MNSSLPISAPTASSSPTPQSTDADLTPATASGKSDSPGLQPSPLKSFTGDTGFEINLGPITLTGLDFSNPLHVGFLAGVISILMTALAYRAYIKRRQHQIDKKALQKAEATFGTMIDRIGKRGLVKISVLDYFLNPAKVREHHKVMEDFEILRGQLHDFENEFGGRINVELEKAVHHLHEVTASESPSIDAIIAALDGIYNAAKRLNLPEEAIHPVSSVSSQLRKATRSSRPPDRKDR